MRDQLQVWGPGWGLASVDPACLGVMAYARLCGSSLSTTRRLALDVTITDHPSASPSGMLPVLVEQPDPAAGVNHVVGTTSALRILARFRAKGSNLDQRLSSLQHSDALALCVMVDDFLRPAWQYTMWISSDNFSRYTWPWIYNALPLGQSHWRAFTYRRHVHKVLANYSEDELMARARQCLQVLDTRLGDEPYFISDKPCSADALIFGYLLAIGRSPFSESPLRVELEKLPRLKQWCQRLERLVFSSVQMPPQKRVPLDDTTKRAIAAVTIASVCMVGYALLVGLPRRLSA